MPTDTKVAIVAAIEREVWPLVKSWPVSRKEYDGRWFKFYEKNGTTLICGGIGAAAARRATEAIISLYHPELLISAGFAGGLDPALQAGHTLTPRRVIDASDSSRTDARFGEGVLVSCGTVADAAHKAKLAEAYGAQAVDMEAAAVARGAQAKSVRFLAVKAVLDERTFAMPPMDRFVGLDGHFCATAFAVNVAVRPWLWPKVLQLARNSTKASRALCAELDRYINEPKSQGVSRSELHPIAKVPN